MPVILTKHLDARTPRKAMALASKATAKRSGRIARNSIRKEIPPPKGAGRFPGYAAKGTLRRSVVDANPTNRPRAKDWMVQVGIKDTKARRYARIHEMGGVIRPKNKPYLMFKLPNGQWIRTKKVRIKRKRYFVTGWKKAVKHLRKDMPISFKREVRYRVPSTVQ